MTPVQGPRSATYIALLPAIDLHGFSLAQWPSARAANQLHDACNSRPAVRVSSEFIWMTLLRRHHTCMPVLCSWIACPEKVSGRAGNGRGDRGSAAHLALRSFPAAAGTTAVAADASAMAATRRARTCAASSAAARRPWCAFRCSGRGPLWPCRRDELRRRPELQLAGLK